jgi:hypothetical protein
MDGAYAVPDPEWMLLDSNFIEPNKFKILFGPYRKYGASTHFIHFNFSQLLATPDKIFQQYHYYIEQWPELFQTETEEIVEVSRSCIADKINDFVDILDALPHRHKRFHDLVALGMSTTALTLSTYNSTRISMLESQIVLNNKKVDHLVDVSNLHKQYFKVVDQKLDDVSGKLATMLRINKND